MGLIWYKQDAAEPMTARLQDLTDPAFRLLTVMRALAAQEDHRGALCKYVNVSVLAAYIKQTENATLDYIRELDEHALIHIREDGIYVVNAYNRARSDSAKRADRRRTNAGQGPDLFGTPSAPEVEVEVDKEVEVPPPTPPQAGGDEGAKGKPKRKPKKPGPALIPVEDLEPFRNDWNEIGPGPKALKISPKAQKLLTLLTTEGDVGGWVWTRENLATAYRIYNDALKRQLWDYKWPSWEDALSRTLYQHGGPGLLRFLPRDGYKVHEGLAEYGERTRANRRLRERRRL